MNREDFYFLLEKVKRYVKEPSTKVRKDVITFDKKLAMTLYYLKDQGSFRMIANSFGCHKASVSLAIKEICGVISKNLGPELIQFPESKEDVQKATAGFLNRFGFLQVIGCIDGTHIPIKQPSENAHDYYSYKMKHTINVQAICNHLGQFIDVEIKWPGSVHDARMFANSGVQISYLEGKFKFFYENLSDKPETQKMVPQILLGDPAYPLLPYCMREYESCTSNSQVLFNQMLRSARNQIECAFGRLKARWRILLRAVDLKLDRVPSVIHTCFILHNFCERRKIEISREEVEEVIIRERRENKTTSDKIYSYHTLDGGKVRDMLADHFSEFL